MRLLTVVVIDSGHAAQAVRLLVAAVQVILGDGCQPHGMVTREFDNNTRVDKDEHEEREENEQDDEPCDRGTGRARVGVHLAHGDEVGGVVQRVGRIERRIVDGEDEERQREDESDGPDQNDGDQRQRFVEYVVNLEWRGEESARRTRLSTLKGSQIAMKRSKLIAVIVSDETLVAQLSMY